MTGFVQSFVEELRRRAEDRAREDAASAGVYARVATDLEAAFREWLAEEMPLDEAASESGYNRVVLRRLRAAGRWSGRRGDLPRRPRGAATAPAPDGTATVRGRRRGLSLAQEIVGREIERVSTTGGRG